MLLRKFVHGPLLDQKVAVEDYAPGVPPTALPLKYMWPEPHGTLHQITNATGNVLETRVTSAWGEPLALAYLSVRLSVPPSEAVDGNQHFHYRYITEKISFRCNILQN